jgi:diguanylate cyclase (GGDEF)-like protein
VQQMALACDTAGRTLFGGCLPAHAIPSIAAALPPAHSLPLLRLRMRLALLTMAVLPTTLALALAHSSLTSQSFTERLRLQDQTAAAARLLDAQLERSMNTVALLATDPDIISATSDPAAAREHARTLLALSAVRYDRLSLFDTTGRELLVLHPPSQQPAMSVKPALLEPALQAGPGTARALTATSAKRSELVFWSAVAGNGGPAAAVLRAQTNVDGLAHSALAALDSGAQLMLVDHSAGQVIDAAGPEHVLDAPTSSEVLAALQAKAGQWVLADGWTVSAVPLSGMLQGWGVVFVDRLEPPQLPLVLLALLGTLSLLLVGITVWMSRQVMRPAEDLASSREQLLKLYEAARNDALRDGLTGLGNHRAFQEELDNQLEWLRRYQVPFALMLIDLDDLKLVNDTGGHAAGDQMMRQMAALIEEARRYTDRAFRIGGDEFALLLPHTSAPEALEFGRRLLGRAQVLPDRPIRFSGGISACPALANDRDQLFAQADAALYWCKRHGRASLDIFDPIRDRQVQEQAVSGQAGHLARVISGGLLRAVYQPVVDLASGTVIAFEGLIRPLPEAGFSNPGELFGAAEAAGRTVELDHACVQTVLAQAVGLAPEQMLSVNLSPRTVEAPHFSVEWLVSLAAASGLDPRRLIVELTEHEMIEDLPRLQRNLAALQQAGIRVAVDDVGAGNAGLRLLSQFRFDIVKVDLSLVQDGTRRDSSRAVLTSLRELAGRWNAYVVAEGLETVSQLRVVREIGVSAGQGFLLARPAPTASLRRIDMASIEAGGVVLEVRQPRVPDVQPRPLPGSGAA